MRSRELVEPQHAPIAFDRLRRHAEELRVGALLVVVDVAVGLAEEFVAGAAVDPHRELIAHRARRDEQGRLLAEHFGDAILERDDGRIFAEDVVADFGGGHGRAHRWRGFRDSIAAQIDECGSQFGFPLPAIRVTMGIPPVSRLAFRTTTTKCVSLPG